MSRSFEIVLSVVPVAIGFLYFVGTIYDEAYFSVFGLDSDQFPRDFNQVVMLGVLAIATAFAEDAIRVLAIAAGLFLLIVMFNAVLEKIAEKRGDFYAPDERPGMEHNPDRLRPRIPFWAHFAGLTIGVFFLIIASAVIALVFVAFAAVLAINEGDRAAHARIETVLGDGWDSASVYDTEVTIVGADSEDHKRRLLNCTPTVCVFLTQSGLDVIELGHIARMQTQVKDPRGE